MDYFRVYCVGLEKQRHLITSDFEQFYKQAFNQLFDGLHRYAMTILKDNDKASDAVQSVFVKWWESQKMLQSVENAKSYLFTAVYRHCLNVIRDEKSKTVHLGSYHYEVSNSGERSDALVADQLDHQIKSTIDQLPTQCQAIFVKSRFENKRYHEIASEMNLSVKTIEVQMGKALRILREKLRDYV